MNFRFKHKRLWVLGIVLLAIGLLTITVSIQMSYWQSMCFPYRTMKDVADSDLVLEFGLERGHLLRLYINSSEPSSLYVTGEKTGEIIVAEKRSTYRYNVVITTADVYNVTVKNEAGHWEWNSPETGRVWVPHDNYVFLSSGVSSFVPQSYYLRTILIWLGIVTLMVGISATSKVIYEKLKATEDSSKRIN